MTENKGIIVSSIGGILVIIGIVAISMESSILIIFPCIIFGVSLAIRGIITMGKSKKKL
jgi:hypothetical protein